MVQVNSLQKRIIAGVLIIGLLTGLVVHNIRKKTISAEAFSSPYGVCIDNHNVTTAGSWSRNDHYSEKTIDTLKMAQSSQEYKDAIAWNIAMVKQYINKSSDLAEGTANMTFWAGVATFITEGKTFDKFNAKDLANAVAWEKYARDAYSASAAYGYAGENIIPEGLRFLPPMTETQLGRIRHENHYGYLGFEYFCMLAGITCAGTKAAETLAAATTAAKTLAAETELAKEALNAATKTLTYTPGTYNGSYPNLLSGTQAGRIATFGRLAGQLAAEGK